MAAAALGAAGPSKSAAIASVEDLRGLSIEELANLEVTSVFKRPEPISRTPASVFVITRDDIHRSGARTLAEALYLAPNLEVARLNARDHVVSARGFNLFQLSNKMLVLIDGRSVYTPLHAGVFWDQQQVVLNDIERIEVISGPAGAVWGANAVNGVINVITRTAHATQGGYAEADVGTQGSGAAARYGGAFGTSGAWRAYGMARSFDETVNRDGSGRNDDWRARQGGFRADWGSGANRFTALGDAFHNPGSGDSLVVGGNLLGRWERQLSGSSSLMVQAYYDSTVRDATGVHDRLDTADLEARHNFRPGDRHNVVWGGGYRYTRSTFELDRAAVFFVTPEVENIQILNLFAEDTIAVSDAVSFTVGAKFEYNSFSGPEFMPSVRLAWMLDPSHLLWGAVSRAVRTPSVIDRDLMAVGIVEKAGEAFDSEVLTAYELGYRGRLTERTSASVTLYYHDYDELRVLTISPTTGLFRFGNAQEGHTAGVEAWADYRISDRWRVMVGLNLFRKNLTLGPGATTAALYQHQGADPGYQVFVRSQFNITDDLEFDLTLRRVDDLPTISVPSYTGLDLRLGWHVTDRVEIALVGRDVLDSQHPETGTPSERGEIPRSIFVSTRVRF